MPYTKGRHDAHRRKEDESRYWLRAGMARVALKAKIEGRPEVDARGAPLYYSNRMAQGHSASTLEKWANGKRTTVVVL